MEKIKAEVQVQSSKFFYYINQLDLRQTCPSGHRRALPFTQLLPLKPLVYLTPMALGNFCVCDLWMMGPMCQLVFQALHVWAW